MNNLESLFRLASNGKYSPRKGQPYFLSTTFFRQTTDLGNIHFFETKNSGASFWISKSSDSAPDIFEWVLYIFASKHFLQKNEFRYLQ